jgi:group I intron endonuclease
MSSAGIYKITSQINHKIYVGESHNLSRRLTRHKADLKYGTHNNPYLQRHVNKYGLNDLLFEVIEELPPVHDVLLEREAYWIHFFDSANSEKGFNLNEGGQGGYSTTLKHKDFILVNMKNGKEYFFKTIVEFEDSLGVFKSKIRGVLLNKENKTWNGWTTPSYYKFLIARNAHRTRPRKKSIPPSYAKCFTLKNTETGETVTSKNILEFSRERTLCYNSLLRIIRGERKMHKNWIAV